MKGWSRHVRTVCSIVLVLCFLTSCDYNEWLATGEQFINDTMSSMGFGEDAPAEDTSKSKKPRTTKPTTAGKLATGKSTKPNSDPKDSSKTPINKSNDIVITRESDLDKQSTKTTDLKTAVAPEFKVEAPVHVKKRVGGVARFITGDDRFVYMDFPQHFAVYDSNLNLLAMKPIAFPLIAIQKYVRDGKIFLFLKEENNILEVFELTQTNTSGKDNFMLTEIASKEMQSDFTWIGPNLLVAFSSNKIQFLDTADFENIRILNETPLSRVRGALLVDKHLFVARSEFLDIVGTEKFDITSSVRIGRKFDIIGLTKIGTTDTLVISYLNDLDQLEGLQFLQLNPERTGVADFGDNQMFENPIAKFSVSLETNLIVGEEITPHDNDSEDAEKNPIQIYSITHKRFLRGPISSNTKLQAWSFNRNLLYLVEDRSISLNMIELDDKIIAQSPTLDTLLNTDSPTPLAQIGASKIVRDEYTVKLHKNLEFMSDAKKIALLDQDHFVLFENTTSGTTHRVFTTSEFSSEDFILSEPSGSNQTKYDKILVTGFGILLYSQQMNQIYFMDVDLKMIQPLPIKVNNLISWTHFTSNDGEALAVSYQNPDKSGAPYIIDFYVLHSLENIQKKNSVTKNEKPFVFYIPDNQIVSVEESQMSLYAWHKILGLPDPVEPKPVESSSDDEVEGAAGDTDLLATSDDETKPATPPKTKQSKTKLPVVEGLQPIEVSKFVSPDTSEDNIKDTKPTQYTAIDARLSPNYDLIYMLFEDQGRLKIRIVDVFDVTNTAVMEDFEITPDQFRGASFSKQGRLFILPSDEGTLFYDVTKLSEIREVAHWPLSSNYVDLANNGTWICVALGPQGVYCGDLLF